MHPSAQDFGWSQSPVLRMLVIAPLLLAGAALVVTFGDRWWHDHRCLLAFRQTLIDRPYGLPLTVHEYSVRRAFQPLAPRRASFPDPRDIRLTLFGSVRVRLSTLIIRASTTCACLLIGAAACCGPPASPWLSSMASRDT